MSAARARLGGVAWMLALLAVLPNAGRAQFGTDQAIGQYYKIEPPLRVDRSYYGVRVERVAPGSLAMPPPLDVIPVAVPIRALTGQITELPERGRVYFTAIDAGGALRLIEVDLIRRESRTIDPPIGSPSPYAAQVLVPPGSSKIYVQWIGPGYLAETNIYDGETLRWLGRTGQFLPDERAAGFVARSPYAWTVDPGGRPVLVDTQRDMVAATFDYQRWFDQVQAVVSDAWGDVLLYRIDVGHDRYQLVDVRSGEIGPPLDLEGYGMVQPRLALNGRMLVLIDIERRPLRNVTRYAETAVALGGGVIFDLRDREQAAEFRIVVPFDFPASSLGTSDDPAVPGRLWIHGPTDDDRFDFELPGCRRGSRGGDGVDATLFGRWGGAEDPYVYRYGISVAEGSEAAAGGMAIEAGRSTDRSGAPQGWGMDVIKREAWLRWTNSLGPADDDVAPGTVKRGFIISADPETRPGIVEYRIQAALGLPRGCESDDRFLDNSLSGWTIAPERVDTIDPRKLAERLERLVERACEIGWIESNDCRRLDSLAEALVDSTSERVANLQLFLAAINDAGMTGAASAVLRDAVQSIHEILDPLP